MASFSLSSLSLSNGSAPSPTTLTSAPTFKIFPRLPLELRNMIWTAAAMEPEIISVVLRRRVKESFEKRHQKQACGASKQMNFDYTITSGPIDLNGNKVAHSTIRAANRESRAAYFKVRSSELYINKSQKVYFNPFIDVLYFSDLSSIYSHHMRQRYRRKMPMLKGLHAATKIAFDPVADGDRIEELGDAVVDDYEGKIKALQRKWADNGQGFKLDQGWKIARLAEGRKLLREMRPRQIRRSRALGRVNSGHRDPNATILRLPLTAADIA